MTGLADMAASLAAAAIAPAGELARRTALLDAAKAREVEDIGEELAAIDPTPVEASGFTFGDRSKRNLLGVRAELRAIAERAIAITRQDFTVYEGLRTLDRQRELVRRGFSRTMASKHLPQPPDGLADAMDLVPWIAGAPKWDWAAIYAIVLAVDAAATALGVAGNIRWGGAWDRVLADFGGDAEAYKREVQLYCARHPGSDFIDGPHYEWRA